MIIDTFIFYNEIEILKTRLEYLSPVVDYFVICEATKTHSNLAKPLYYFENKGAFSKYQDKIINLIFDGPYSTSPWDNETNQRNFIKTALMSFHYGDLILHSDLDEIPKREVLTKLIHKYTSNKFSIFKFVMINFQYSFNYISGRKPIWIMASAFFYDILDTQLDDSQFIYNEFLKSELNFDTSITKIRLSHGNKFIAFSGFHLSYFLDKDEILQKLQGFSHFNEFNIDNPEAIQNIIESEVDLLGFRIIKLGYDLFNSSSLYSKKLIFSNNEMPFLRLLRDVYIFQFFVFVGVYDIYKLLRRKLRILKAYFIG